MSVETGRMYALTRRFTELSPQARRVFLQKLAAEEIDFRLLPITASPREGNQAIASYAQQRLWFLWRLDPQSAAYNITGAVRLQGALSVPIHQRVLNAVTSRHESLRTTFVERDGQAYQVISPPSSVNIELVDLSSAPDAAGHEEIRQRAELEARSAFDLETGPLLRVCLLQLSAVEHVLLLTMHHIVSDGWSMNVLVQEFAELYSAHANNVPVQMQALPIQYADYAAWQRRWLEAGELERQLAYWKTQLGDEHPPLELPLDRPRPVMQSYRGASHDFELEAPLTRELRAFAQANGVTLFVLLLAAFKVQLYRYTGQADLRVGMPIANRQRLETERLIGFFVNTQVLRTRLDERRSFLALLAQIQEAVLQAQSHQDLPFERLVEELNPDRSLAYNPLFQIKLTLQGDPLGSFDVAGLHISPYESQATTTHFDLSVDFVERAHDLSVRFTYATDLFDSTTIERMGEHWRRLLSALLRHPSKSIAQIEYLSGEEEAQLASWSGEGAAMVWTSVPALFAAAVARAGEQPALRFEEEVLSYRELDARANQVARYLRSRGVGAETRIALSAQRSVASVVGMLGILKSGAAYVPLDPKLPVERLRYQFADSRAVMLLHDGAALEGLDVEQIALGDACFTRVSDEALQTEIVPSQAAYLIYTSGSTGEPKAVVVSHGALSAYVQGMLERLALDPAASMGVVSSMAADLGHTVLFGALCSGSLLHLIDADRSFDADLFAQYMAQHRVGVLKIVPSHLTALLQAKQPQAVLPEHALILGGESTSEHLLATIRRYKPSCRIFNHYGPTETTVGVIAGEITQEEGAPPLGKPFRQARAYILDAQLQRVPHGVPGDLYLGGSTVARGYEGRPDLTAERFVPDPFFTGSTHGGERLYRTGDRARYRRDGQIEFLGRSDDQVKIRGYRVELAEIAQALRAQPDIKDALVLARRGTSGVDRLRLIGYCIPGADTAIDSEQLKDTLKQQLPEYMVPEQIVLLDAWPLTRNGKINRQALPDGEARSTASEATQPRTEVERQLAEIWCSVLGVEQVGIHDNFFELGGDSILSLQIIARARKQGIALTPRQLFEAQSIAALGERLHSDAAAQQPDELTHEKQISYADRTQPLPLSYAQQRLWFLWLSEPESAGYHVERAVRLSGKLRIDALQKTFNFLLARHESLRTTFRESNGQVYQTISAADSLPIQITDLGALPPSERQARAKFLAESEAQLPFDLRTGPLLRLQLLRLADAEHVLLLTMHHIVSDGWSMNVLVEEFAKLYDAYSRDHEPRLDPLSIQYADYAQWQRNWLASGELDRQLDYWRHKLGDEHPMLELPTDRPRQAVQSYRGASHRFQLDEDLATSLRALTQDRGITLFMLLLASFKTLLYRYTGQTDLRVGATVANRHRPETQGLIGFFVNVQVLRTELDGQLTFEELLQRVKNTALEAQAHQDLPFERLVEAVNPDRSLAHNPLFQVAHNHQWRRYEALHQLTDLRLEGLPHDLKATQFDLILHTEEDQQQLWASFAYNTDLFDRDTIERLARHWLTLLRGAVEAPRMSISRLPMMGTDETAQLLSRWNSAPVVHETDLCLHQRIEIQALRQPQAIALAHEAATLTYGELNARANQLARYLRAEGVGPEALVGICVERSFDLVIGIVAILKAGGAYLPLDPDHPSERLHSILADARPRIVLTHTKVSGSLHLDASITAWCFDRDGSQVQDLPRGNLANSTHSRNLAYCIYTSGSTGKPKGALLSHYNATRLFDATANRFRFDERDVWTLFHSSAFDFSVWEIFGALLYGGTLVIVPFYTSRSPEAFLELLRRHRVTVLNQTPSAFRQLVQQLRLHDAGPSDLALRYVIFGGEALQLSSLKPWFEHYSDRGTQLVNMYGITETTVHVSYRPLAANDTQLDSSPIGRAIPDLSWYVLDEQLQPVAPGAKGELYVGGAGLSRGYLNRAELTAERFVPNPFTVDTGERLYRTGDLARTRADGEVEYLGRADQQVKVRGYRIELGEIEARLLEQEGVSEAIVIAREQNNSVDRQLVGYVVGDAKSLGAIAEHFVAGTEELVDQWTAVFNNTYSSNTISQRNVRVAPSFTGWNSSFTDEAIPVAEMQEWLDGTLARIQALSPRKVLEIGCGVGLLLDRLAPACEQYWGTDLSAQAVEQLQQWSSSHQALAHVQLMNRQATDFAGIPAGTFDTVILNSVIQYFPSAQYLVEVLRGAVNVLDAGGRVFLGDLRHLGTLTLFHTSVQLARAPAGLAVGQLRGRIERAIAQEKELVIDPMFFEALRAAVPGIHAVRVFLRRGSADNELTRYRYDVVLDVGGHAPRSYPDTYFMRDTDTLALLKERVQQYRPARIVIEGVANRRVATDLSAWKHLQATDAHCSVAELRERLRQDAVEGENPEDFWTLGDAHGYDVNISWTNGDSEGRFDVELIDRKALMRWRPAENLRPDHVSPLRDMLTYTTNPVLGKFKQQWGATLRGRLKQVLPDYMVPAHIMVLERIPLTVNGKLDRRALPAVELGGDGHTYAAPRTPVEAQLAQIWSQVLSVTRVGVHDNFFELGGHSLLATQLVSRINRELSVHLTLRDVFEAEHLSALAARVLALQADAIPEDVLNAEIAAALAAIKGMSDHDVQQLTAARD